MTTTTIRVPDRSEAAQLADVLNEHSRALHGDRDLTESVVGEWFDNPDVVIRVADVDGEPVCYGDLALSADGARADFDVREHPDHHGSAEALLAELERIAAERGATTVRAHASSDDESLLATLEARGYEPIRHSFRMLRVFDGQVETASWPDGIAVRTLRDGDEHAVYEAAENAFADHWGFEPQPYERWARWFYEGAHYDPSLFFLALEGESIAGVSLCSMHSSGDPTYGWIGTLGVRPSWRRRGLGLGLLLHSFGEFQRRGCDRVGLGVDAQSTTGALQLYERAGMHVVRRQDSLERSL